MRATPFANMMMISSLNKPYKSQRIAPANIIVKVPADNWSVSFVFHTLITWGNKAKVEQKAAVYPIKEIIIMKLIMPKNEEKSSIYDASKQNLIIVFVNEITNPTISKGN